MDDTQITTEAQLDAALAAQRARRIESLRRQTNRSYVWLMLMPAVAIGCFLIAYLEDRHWASVSGIGVMLLSIFFGYIQLRKQRETAANELAREFRNRA